MRSAFAHDSYTPLEIAQAAGVPEADVLAALGYSRELVPHAEAVRIGRMLRAPPVRRRRREAAPQPLFALFSDSAPGAPIDRRAAGAVEHAARGPHRPRRVSATFNLTPRAASLRPDDRPPIRCGWCSSPRLVRAAAAAAAGCCRRRRRRRRCAKADAQDQQSDSRAARAEADAARFRRRRSRRRRRCSRPSRCRRSSRRS